MADDSGGTGFMSFVLAGILVVLAIIAFVLYGGEGTGPRTVNLNLPNTTTPNTR
jgi:hypothetical protein